MAPFILNLDSSWRWMYNLTPGSLLAPRKDPGTKTVVGWLGLSVGKDGWVSVSVRMVGVKPQILQPVAKSLYWLSYRGCCRQLETNKMESW
jgi:hypothetical protein